MVATVAVYQVVHRIACRGALERPDVAISVVGDAFLHIIRCQPGPAVVGCLLLVGGCQSPEAVIRKAVHQGRVRAVCPFPFADVPVVIGRGTAFRLFVAETNLERRAFLRSQPAADVVAQPLNRVAIPFLNQAAHRIVAVLHDCLFFVVLRRHGKQQTAAAVIKLLVSRLVHQYLFNTSYLFHLIYHVVAHYPS